MKVVILAGGLGTRLQEETEVKPKPMVEIGGRPILWHIMNIYAHYSFKEFVIALGYKGEIIKNYFLNYFYYSNSLSITLSNGHVYVHNGNNKLLEDSTVHLVDAGKNTGTGGRLKRVSSMISEETFMLTYGDGVSNVNVKELVEFHKSHGKLATITAVRPPARFGSLNFNGQNDVELFAEKPRIGEGWINGGFFVLEPEVLDYIDGDSTAWEENPMERLVKENQIKVYRHHDFWQCMDTLRDVRFLENMWKKDQAPWKLWD
jgi:glucose-1-phosphate cytidylyltransferase